MPANKKHHYVPRFYLKGFSPDTKSIHLYNFAAAKVIRNAKLKNQCYRDYMYGKEGEHEQRLSQIEGLLAQYMRTLLPACALPPPFSPDHETLCILALLQYGRTAHYVDGLDDMADGMWKSILKKDPRVSEEMLEKVRIVHTDPANQAVAMMLRHYPLILDMAYKILAARPGSAFITSDNPVVFYNQLMEGETFGSKTGLIVKGLQIFFPLTPKHLLCFYDADVYACGPRKADVVEVPTDADMQSLNALQVAAAFENVYFEGAAADTYRAVAAGRAFRRKTKARTFEGPERFTSEGSRQLIGMTREDVRTNLSLSFVKLLKPAKRWREERRQPGPKPMAVERNPSLVRAHEEFLALVPEGRYEPSAFVQYLREREAHARAGPRATPARPVQ